jgi:hypothetical protein
MGILFASARFSNLSQLPKRVDTRTPSTETAPRVCGDGWLLPAGSGDIIAAKR